MSERDLLPMLNQWLPRAALAASCLLGAAGVPERVHAQDLPAWMIVLDGSGSMWGKIEPDKNPKFVHAKEGLRQSLAKLPDKTPVGLAVTSHLRRGDCTDAHVMAELAPRDVTRIVGPLEKFNPKGRGPLVQALREAVKVLKPGAPSNVLLIHDGADNCQQDACAAAAEIKASHPQLKVNLVSITVEKDELPRIACLARETGGRLIEARTPAEIVAAIGEILGPAAAQPAAATAAAAPAKELVPPKPVPAVRKPSPDGASSLHATLSLGADGAALDSPIRWMVRPQAEADGARAILHLGPTLSTELPPGLYVVDATLGPTSARETVEVKAKGTTETRLKLADAGVLQLSARLAPGSEALADAVFTVQPASAGTPAPGGAGTTTSLPVVTRAPDGHVALKPGAYTVEIALGHLRASKAVTVEAGKALPVDLVLGAGRLELATAPTADGAAMSGVTYTVAIDDPDASKGQREVARSAADVPIFWLPAGTYAVTVRKGSAVARERIGIGAGELVRHTLVLPMSGISLTARPRGGSVPAGTGVQFRAVKLAEASEQEVASTSAPGARLDLPAGRHRIEVRLGEQNARASHEIDVKPGTDLELTFDLDVAAVTLKRGSGQVAGADVFWEVVDQGGRIVWRTGQLEPKGFLAPGAYVVRSSTRAGVQERSVELKAGDKRVVEIVTE